jgi:outer membrane protein assembly factor BamD
MSAFSSYRRSEYDATITTAQRYLTLYPGTPDAAYAQYLMAQSYFNQIPDVTRDQSKTQKALDSMQEVVTKYPGSEYVDDARKKILITRDQLAGKEMQIGRYYLERREYVAAINRFKTVTTQYQDTRHVEEALERMVEANLALGLVGEAQTDAALLGHNFPDSHWYKDAYTLLKKKGVEPVDNGGAVTAAVAKKTG